MGLGKLQPGCDCCYLPCEETCFTDPADIELTITGWPASDPLVVILTGGFVLAPCYKEYIAFPEDYCEVSFVRIQPIFVGPSTSVFELEVDFGVPNQVQYIKGGIMAATACRTSGFDLPLNFDLGGCAVTIPGTIHVVLRAI